MRKSNFGAMWGIWMLLYMGFFTGKTVLAQGVIIDGISYLCNTNKGTAGVYITSKDVVDVNIRSSVTFSNKSYRVTSIHNSAFQDCNELKRVAIPNSVTNIEDDAFFSCDGLTNVTIGNSVANIGDYAFSYCPSLMNVTIPGSVTNIGNNAFKGCSGLTEVTIPENVTDLGCDAFNGCSGLKEVTILGDVKSGSWRYGPPFSDCPNIERIVLGSKMTEIGNFMFAGCSLEHVTIPENITSIGVKAFADCSNLPSVTIPESVTNLDRGCFFGCTRLTKATILCNVSNDYGKSRFSNFLYTTPLFEGCTNLTTVALGDKMTYVGSHMFAGCTGLTEVTIPQNVTHIGENCFKDCIGLAKVTILGNVTNEYSRPFNNCPNLATVVLGNQMTRIGADMFSASGLKRVTIGKGVTEIGSGAFRTCTNLATVTIPECVTNLGSGAFSYCTSLTNVCFKGKPPNADYPSFYNVASDARGYYSEDYASEWRAVIGADGKWQGLIMVPVEELVPPELQIESADPMKGRITLVWTDEGAGGGVTYSIYRGAGEDRVEAELVASGVTETTWTDYGYWTAEPALKPLNYWVVANDSGGGERESKPVQTRRRFGVFVGLSDYDPKLMQDRMASAVNDARKLRELFVGHGEMDAAHAVLLTNSDAKWDGVSNAIAEKTEVLQPGDLFVLYIATHGEYTNGKARVVLYDSKPRMDEIFSVLDQFNAGAVVIPIFMACHSGAFADYASVTATSGTTGTALDETTRGFKLFVESGLAKYRENMPVLASCGAEELSSNFGTYSDFGEAFIHQGWENGYADGPLQGVGYNGVERDGYVSFWELIKYAQAFARGFSDTYGRASVQWTVKHEQLLRNTLAGRVAGTGPQASVPNAPTVVTATDGTLNSRIHVAWSGVSGATHYWVYVLKDGRSGKNDDDWECLYYLAKSTEIAHWGALRGKNYQYRVRAVNGAGASELSEMVAQGSRRDGTIWEWIWNYDAASEESVHRWLRDFISENNPWLKLDNDPVEEIRVVVAAAESAFSISGVVTLPEEIGGYAVTSIPDSAFENCGVLTGMVIPASVTNVGANAFAGCDELATLYVPAAWEGTDMLEGAGVPEGCEVVYGGGADGKPDLGFWQPEGWPAEVYLARSVYGMEAATEFAAGEEFYLCCGLANRGDADAENYLAEGRVRDSAGNEVASWRLPPFDLCTGVHVWARAANCMEDGTGLESIAVPGEYTLEFTLDPDGLLDESDEANNCRTLTFTVLPPATQRVVFDANGGACGTAAKTYSVGEAYGALPTPKWSGHVFLGWFTAATGGTEVTAADKASSETVRTLYAHWTDQQATTFMGNGGKPATQTTTNTIYADYGTFPEAKWSGHVLVGWFNAPEGGKRVYTNSTVTLAATRTLYAQWTDQQVTTFKANGGYPATQKTTNTIYTAYGAFPEVKYSGHALVGWFNAPEGGKRIYTNSTVTLAATRTLYAQWTTNQVTTFKGNGGTPEIQKTTNAIYTAYGTLPEAAWENHAFLGWFNHPTKGKRVYTNSTVTLAATRSLYAHWTDRQVVTFKGNGGSPASKVVTNTMGEAYGTMPMPKWSGHAFLGWFTAAEGGTEVSAADLVALETTRTLYAHWTDRQVTTFLGNGGKPLTQATTNTIYADYGAFPEAKWSGHALVGWFNMPEGGKRVYTNSTVTLAATRTLYAQWTTNQVTTFKGNGGTPATQKTTNAIYTAYGAFPSATWEGHKFLGWYNASEGGKRVYTNSTVTLAAERTLWAHWTTAKGFVIAGFAMDADGVAEGASPRAVRGAEEATNVCHLRLVLVAGAEYEIQWTASMAGEWETMERFTAETDGEVEMKIEAPGGEKGFFRVLCGEDGGGER